MMNLNIFEIRLNNNTKYKFCDFLILIIFIIYCENAQKYSILRINNSLEKDLKKYFCKILTFENDYNCYKEIFINDNFFYDVKSISKDRDLLIERKNTRLKNLFLLIGLIPFFKGESNLFYKINKKNFILIFCNNYGEIINNNLIKIKKEDFEEKQIELINLLDYEWEIIPSKNIINFIRYIINNFYNEECLEMFDSSLNKNYKRYLEKNRNNISFKFKTELISKKKI